MAGIATTQERVVDPLVAVVTPHASSVELQA